MVNMDKLLITTIIFALSLLRNVALAIPLINESDNLVLVCYGFSNWKKFEDIDRKNLFILNYKDKMAIWLHTNIFDEKRSFFDQINSTFYISNQIRKKSIFGTIYDELDLVLTSEEIGLVKPCGKITQSSSDDYIEVILPPYRFNATCVYYPEKDYITKVIPNINKIIKSINENKGLSGIWQ